MDFKNVGKEIKDLRLGIGMSQKELCEGICTQAQISKIESGKVYPYADTLYLIAKKLGVDVNYFFDIASAPRLDYVQEVIRFSRKLVRYKEYEEVMRIVNVEEKKPCL